MTTNPTNPRVRLATAAVRWLVQVDDGKALAKMMAASGEVPTGAQNDEVSTRFDRIAAASEELAAAVRAAT